ncbi:unnamed protein product [Ranitomeya imitator]|uniref:C2H2-type domain-containing protein n=1 Tax=Ranitomeya imitator TaxID=111125 RepID=A0ABN9MDA4_9NEOB|nr:unnamed protein product [Ranitomeya imitator]
MVEEPKSLQLNGSSDGTKCEFLPEPHSEQGPSFSDVDFGDHLDYVRTPTVPPLHTDGTKCEFLPEPQSEQRPSFSDIDFGDHLDYVRTPTAPPSHTDKEVAISCKDMEVLEMSCSSDEFIEPLSEPPQSERIDSSSGDRADEDHPDDLQSPPPPIEKQKEIRKEDDGDGEDNDTSNKEEEETPDLPPDDVTAQPVPEPPKVTEPPSDAMDEPSSSELWIAQDGTTSSTWIPQDDPRPKGRNCFKYGTTILLPELPMKMAESDPRCHLCDITFPDKYELELHQRTMHSKKQRL